jgi:radical SAM protein with 4Fe4S-binding SPASM domain
MDDCGGIPQQGYGEFSDWLHRKVGNQRIPISGSLEVTMRCNLRCQHCYIPMEQRAKPNQEELSFPEIQRILDEITDAGCLWLLLTGGDPFMRRDFLDIYSYARRKGLILTLFTNGTQITPRIADYLAEWRPFNIEITLYGATQETYERVTGIPGSYALCRRGIDLLLERNLPLGLKTMVMTLNRHELEQMKSLAASLGVKFRIDPILNPALDSAQRPTFFRLTPMEIVEMEKADPERVAIWQKQFQKDFRISNTDRRMYLCGAGKQAFHIDAAGILSGCLTARQPSYDLRHGSFKEGWEIDLAQMISRQYSPDFECLGCDLRPMCAQCPAVAELEHGDVEKPVDFLCQVTRLRRDAFAQTR